MVTYGNIPKLSGETDADAWARYQGQVAQRQQQENALEQARAAMATQGADYMVSGAGTGFNGFVGQTPQQTAALNTVRQAIPQQAVNTPAYNAQREEAIRQMWNDTTMTPEQKRNYMSQYGVSIQDVMNLGMDQATVASKLNTDGGANGWGGLHFNSQGQLSGTDTGGMIEGVAQPVLSSIRQAAYNNNQYQPASVVGGLFADTFKKANMPSEQKAADAWSSVTPFGLVGQLNPDWTKDVKINMGNETITTPAPASTTTPTTGLLTSGGIGNGGGTAGTNIGDSYWGLYDFAESIKTLYPEEAAKLKAFAESKIAESSGRAQAIGGTANTLGVAGNVPANPMAADPASVAAAKEAANAAARGTGVTAGGNGYGGGGNYGYGGTGSTGDRD